MTACREVLRSFSLSETKTSVEQNLRHALAHHDSLMCQQVAVDDAPEKGWLLDAKMHSVEQIIEEEQAHRVQVAALSQMPAPSDGEGGRTGERTEETQQFDGRTPGHIKNIT